MTLNGVVTVILRYFTELGNFWGRLRHLFCSTARFVCKMC